jgi:hypothetical protein
MKQSQSTQAGDAAAAISNGGGCVDPVWLDQMRQWDGGGEIELRAITLYQMGKGV